MNEPEQKREPFSTVLMVEDDGDDRFFMEEAFKAVHCEGELRFLGDGEELMEYLQHRRRFKDAESSPRPSLILLDLNIPKKDGRQVLVEIKADPDLRKIPVVVWTTSDLREDETMCLEAGADGYITKPNNYVDLEKAVEWLCTRWLHKSPPQ